MITRSRVSTKLNPNIPAVQTYLATKYAEALSAATSQTQIDKAKRLYDGVTDSEIYTEYVKEPVNLSNQFLCCFSILDRGIGYLDARLDYTTFDDVVTHFKIPVRTVSTYDDLIIAVRAGKIDSLFKVTSGSGQYGICIDNRLTVEQRYNNIIEILGGVVFNTSVNYTGDTFGSTNPNVGELALSYPGFYTYTLEVYPIEEIQGDNSFNGVNLFNGGMTYSGN